MRVFIKGSFYAQAKDLRERGKGYAYRIMTFEEPVEVRETTEAHCPAALSLGGEDYRLFEGTLHRRLRPREGVADRSWLTTKAMSLLDLGFSESDLGQPEGSFVLMRGAEHQRAKGVEEVRHAAKDLLLVDDAVWFSVLDPVLKATVDDGEATVTVVPAPRVGTKGHFRLDEEPVLRAYLGRAAPRAAYAPLPDYVLLDREALGHDPQAAFLRQVASEAAYACRDEVAFAPLETMTLYARVRDLAAGRRDPVDGASDATVLRRLLEDLEAARPGTVDPDSFREACAAHDDATAFRSERVRNDEEDASAFSP